MVNYWKAKVLPKIKKVFEKNSVKKAAGAEAVKTFDDSKEENTKAFEEKKTELEPKVLVIYEACTAEIKALVKTPTDAGLKKNSAGVTKFLEELEKIDFPGSKAISEASSKIGPEYISGPVFFIFEKIKTFLPVEEPPAPPAAEEPAAVVETATKEIVVEEEKKEEEVPPPAEAPPAAVEAVAEPAVAEPVKA